MQAAGCDRFLRRDGTLSIGDSPGGGDRMLENALRTLFDFQRFENNQQLRSVIEAVEEKYPDGLILSRKFP